MVLYQKQHSFKYWVYFGIVLFFLASFFIYRCKENQIFYYSCKNVRPRKGPRQSLKFLLITSLHTHKSTNCVCPMTTMVHKTMMRLLSNNGRASPRRSPAPKAKEHEMPEESLLIFLVLLWQPQAVVYKQFSCGMCCEISNRFKRSCYLGALFTCPNGEAERFKRRFWKSLLYNIISQVSF